MNLAKKMIKKISESKTTAINERSFVNLDSMAAMSVKLANGKVFELAEVEGPNGNSQYLLLSSDKSLVVSSLTLSDGGFYKVQTRNFPFGNLIFVSWVKV